MHRIGSFVHHFVRVLRTARRTRAGFTLLELLIVLAIIALLAGLAGPPLLRYLGKAKSDTARVQIEQLVTSLDLFKLDVGRYPTAEEGLDALVRAPAALSSWNGPYIKKAGALVDPWGVPYQYRTPGEHGEIDVFTLGADKKAGGSGEDQDIGNW
jgi:general secretion pathway protein G